MLTLLSTIILLGVLIFVHELGHFLAAKLLGVKVERFSLGFPPKMIGRKIGETEYVLSWIPLGGYVKMLGENPDEVEEVSLEDRHRSFNHKPAWARFLIVFAGPGFNFLFALLVFWIMFAVQGVPHLTPKVAGLQPDMPAIQAGFRIGDEITAIEGREVVYWDHVLDYIRAAGDREIKVQVRRDGRTMTFNLQPKMVESRNLFGEKIHLPMIGIQAGGETVIEEINPVKAIWYGAVRTWDLTELTILSVVKMIQGRVSPKTLGGPIFIAQLAGEQAKQGFGPLIFLMALLSVNLGILNLLPIPVLDGGHLFFFLLEMVFRRPISLNVRERAQQAGLFILILFMAFVFYNDLARIFTGREDPGGENKPAVEQNDNSGAGNVDSNP